MEQQGGLEPVVSAPQTLPSWPRPAAIWLISDPGPAAATSAKAHDGCVHAAGEPPASVETPWR